MKKVYYLLGLSLLGASLVACAPSKKDSNKGGTTSPKTSATTAITKKESESSTAATDSTSSKQKSAESTVASSKTVESNSRNSFTWSSMDEAINFYEQVYKNTQNEVSKDIAWENYDRSAWSLEKNQGNMMILHWRNVGGAGGSYVKFIKISATKTKLVQYDGNAAATDQPGQVLIVNNADYKVINK